MQTAGRDFARAARTWMRLAESHRRNGRPLDAEACIGEAMAAAGRSAQPRLQAGLLDELAQAVALQPGGLPDARAWVEHALTIEQRHDPLADEAWRRYGVLAGLAEREASDEPDAARRAALLAQARDHREVERRAPRIVAALHRLAPDACDGRALVLERLARCFDLGGRPDLALDHVRQALCMAGGLAGDEMRRLRDALGLQAADALHRLGHGEQAERLRRRAVALQTADRLRSATAMPGDAEASAAETAFTVAVWEHETIECVFEPDLVLDATPSERMSWLSTVPQPLPGDSVATLAPGTRTLPDGDGAVRFCLPAGEPAIERRRGYVAMRRLRREVCVAGCAPLLWRLLRVLDGERSTHEVLAAAGPEDRPVAARLLGALAAAGVVDASGRAAARWLHAATKKGVLPGGGLDGEAVLRLATDGGYRTHAAASRIVLGDAVPERLQAFHALTRARRSRRSFDPRPLARGDVEALLQTACGVTGTLRFGDREVKLRAYPSSGALYAVEIYPVMLRVEGMPQSICHYRAAESTLDVVKAPVEPQRIVTAALPVEREMMATVPLLVCLVGHFARHERKYGQGGYRMMVAEAGHVSANLVLAATALGLSARPFGGVFDDLLNRELGLDDETGQFLLSVLVGHPGPAAAA